MDKLSKLLNKLRNLPKGVKVSVAFFLANIITSGIGYIVTPIYTRMLPSDIVGQASVFLTWVDLFGIIAMFCLSYGVFNNGMVDYPDQRDDYSFSMLILSNIITAGFTLIIVALYPFIGGFLNMDLPLVLLMCGLFFVQPAYKFWTVKQRYEWKYKSTVLWTVFCAFASPTVAILCIYFSDQNKLYARLFGAELTLIAIYLGFYFYLAFKNKWKINTSFWKAALLFNIPLIPHYLSTFLLGSSNKLLIEKIVGESEVAYYNVVHSVAVLVTIFWNSINSSLVPYTYEKCKENDYKSISKVMSPILTMLATVCVGVMMFAPEVVAIMAPPEYREAIYIIPSIIGGVFFQVQYFIYANIVYYHKKPRYVMYASVTSVAINLVLGYLLISTFGYLAAGYATLISYFVQASLDYIAMRKVVKEEVYNMRYIGILSAVVIAVAVLSTLVYDFIFVRYGIIAVILVVCFLLRSKIIQAVKNLKFK